MANYQPFETVNGIYTLSDNKIYNVKEGEQLTITRAPYTQSGDELTIE